jgi:hypothetical protein
MRLGRWVAAHGYDGYDCQRITHQLRVVMIARCRCMHNTFLHLHYGYCPAKRECLLQSASCDLTLAQCKH